MCGLPTSLLFEPPMKMLKNARDISTSFLQMNGIEPPTLDLEKRPCVTYLGGVWTRKFQLLGIFIS